MANADSKSEARRRRELREGLARVARERPEAKHAFATLDSYRRCPDRDIRNDRAAVLISAGLVEWALQEALIARFVPMERKEKGRIFDTGPEREGVLATFAARSVIGYAIGIYGVDGLNDIDMMRIIRNAFAHSTSDLDLNMHPFAESCNFNFLRKAANVSLFRPLPENPLEKFATMAFYLVNLLLMQEYYVKHDMINQNPWTDFF